VDLGHQWGSEVWTWVGGHPPETPAKIKEFYSGHFQRKVKDFVFLSLACDCV